MKLSNHLDAQGFEIRQVRAQVLGGDPALGPTDAGRFWYDSAAKQHRGWDGATAHTLTNLIESVVGSGPLSAILTGKRIDLSIAAATGAAPGTMSATDKAKLDAATAVNNPSALVQRDANGDFAAGTITAALSGLAADATLHGGATLASVRDFSLSTGQRTAASAISDFTTAVRAISWGTLANPSAAINAGSQRITAVADPTSAQDAATKAYVDSVASGLDPKASVKWATAAALPASVYANGASGSGATLTASANGLLGTVGGGTPAVGERILVKNQASTFQNGIYVVTSVGAAGATWVLTRATDADVAAEVSGGLFTFVEAGTYAATGWVLNATGAIVIGTTALVFQQFSGAGSYSASNGVLLTGTNFTAVGTANRIAVGAGGIDIASTYVGQTSITTLGVVGTGTWQGTAVGLAYGGTGSATAVGARTNLGAIGRNAVDVPALAAGGTHTFTHGLNSLDVVPALKEVASGDIVLADFTVIDANNVRLTSGGAIAAGAYRIVVVG